MIDQTWNEVIIAFVLSFEYEDDRISYDQYYMLLLILGIILC